MAAIFTNSKSSIESLAKSGHTYMPGNTYFAAGWQNCAVIEVRMSAPMPIRLIPYNQKSSIALKAP
jgi:hypothetical protein